MLAFDQENIIAEATPIGACVNGFFGVVSWELHLHIEDESVEVFLVARGAADPFLRSEATTDHTISRLYKNQCCSFSEYFAAKSDATPTIHRAFVELMNGEVTLLLREVAYNFIGLFFVDN